MAKRHDEDDDRYDYDFMPTKAYEGDYLKLRREAIKKEEEEKEKIRLEKIKAKGEYELPDEFDVEHYKKLIEDSKYIYDTHDAKKLLHYMLQLRHFYANSMFKFYESFKPEKVKELSAFILAEISGNKLENDNIVFDEEEAGKNRKQVYDAERELISQRKSFYYFQTHHPREIQPLFNKKSAFLVLQQRGFEARLMYLMYRNDFYVDLPLYSTKDVKKINNMSEDEMEEKYQFPIIKDIIKQKESLSDNLVEREKLARKCAEVRASLEKLRILCSYRENPIKTFELYQDSMYVKTLQNNINKSIKFLENIETEIGFNSPKNIANSTAENNSNDFNHDDRLDY